MTPFSDLAPFADTLARTRGAELLAGGAVRVAMLHDSVGRVADSDPGELGRLLAARLGVPIDQGVPVPHPLRDGVQVEYRRHFGTVSADWVVWGLADTFDPVNLPRTGDSE